ncbi:MAG: trypsin-like peptidase domain-containing protein [Acidobacteria bacterium]|nr:trypsin-like peptidase domain-containing protein [Acidobacteriota bacterium]MBA3886751.1 trypsin-like peptidase domain-containing protein [Acidobacteriota bacterium]
MSRRFTLVGFVLGVTVAFLLGLMIAGELTHAPSVVSTAPRAPARGADLARPSGGALVNFADVAERINASVVNIDATSRAPVADTQRNRRRGGSVEGPLPRDPDVPRQGAGTGFIIDDAGFILTNHHVIANADRINVTLADGRAFRAEVVGTDPAIDVALLRIEGASRLQAVPLGNSDHLRVGEWVCAIGNPLGYVHSVTVGVVSFIGRKLFDPSLDDYIQTDAAINFGNSGGPLLNARGEVVGINSAISSRATSIGFAVPINQAIAILPQLKASGRVSRGYMGVFLTDVTPALQRSLNLSVAEGALVQDLTSGSPAERAGMRAYDVIVGVDGQDVGGNDDLIRSVSARQPGTVARLDVVRDNRRVTVPVKLAERPVDGGTAADPLTGRTASPRPPAPVTTVPLGVSVRPMDRGRGSIPDAVDGVIVSRVDPTGTAYPFLRRGVIIMEINRQPVRSLADYERLVGAARPGDVLAIYFFDPDLDPNSSQRVLVTVPVE